jgi:hypothetical protein
LDRSAQSFALIEIDGYNTEEWHIKMNSRHQPQFLYPFQYESMKWAN